MTAADAGQERCRGIEIDAKVKRVHEAPLKTIKPTGKLAGFIVAKWQVGV